MEIENLNLSICYSRKVKIYNKKINQSLTWCSKIGGGRYRQRKHRVPTVQFSLGNDKLLRRISSRYFCDKYLFLTAIYLLPYLPDTEQNHQMAFYYSIWNIIFQLTFLK